jgi:hypothetical protein
VNESIELISLAELIEQVKADLLGQTATTGTSAPVFFVDAVEITAQVVAQREKGEGGRAGLSLSVLGFKADAGIDTKTTLGSQLTQTVTIKLSPLLSKDAYLARLAPDQRQGIEDTAAAVIARGGARGTGEIA